VSALSQACLNRDDPWPNMGPRAGVAQLVEHFIRNEGVIGSSPIVGSPPRFMNDRSSPLLRTGRVDDVEAVLDLWRRAEASPSSTESAEDVRGLLGRDPEALIVAEAVGEIVGTLIVGWDGWRATFYRLAVDPIHRRHGLATELVRTGEERLRALGARRLNAIAESHKPAAMAFWASAGYELQTSRSRFVKNLP
jgi:ribosomal protein S18 acetylase RimI-like enzyme